MAVGLSAPPSLSEVPGIRLGSLRCGIKPSSNKHDLVLVEIAEDSSVAAVFTRNRFRAAPVLVAEKHLEGIKSPRYLLINSGNANAGTGAEGIQKALQCCQAVAATAGCSVEEVLPFSTGVIGQPLPVERISPAIPPIFQQLAVEGWMAAATGIMTTDTLPKGVSRQLEIDGNPVTITGICKGSGMIRPDMATMLAYIATDAMIAKGDLQNLLTQAVSQSFNAITVDGDTSTNDACVLIATGRSSVFVDASNSDFVKALNEVFRLLAQSIVRDGEGATKFVTIEVDNARSKEDARALAFTIAHSPLVKTALFASDANWGRILAAIGRAEVETIDIDRIDLYLGSVCLIEQGLPHPDYTEEKGHQQMANQDILIRVDMNIGAESATIWTTDLSYDYVKINAEYRT